MFVNKTVIFIRHGETKSNADLQGLVSQSVLKSLRLAPQLIYEQLFKGADCLTLTKKGESQVCISYPYVFAAAH